ncbi:MAG: signal peptidase I [Clostridia bacterium]|nr:signal peptidase I [Clostridia bacterium]
MNEFEENNNETAETEETGKKSIAKEIWEWVYTLAIAIIIAMLIKGFLFDIVRVDGSSMFPTLVNNDRLIVTKLGYKPAQGDIIILDSEYKNREEFYDKLAVSKDKDELSVIDKALVQSKLPSNLKKKYYVKRIIAMPGQTVDLVDGKVYVDGTPLDEPYYDGVTSSIDPTVEYPVTVDDDCVFVMGDNRNHSKDSRSSELGQVPFGAILGKSQIRIWPFNDIGATK